MPTARLCPLADVAARLPADSWIAQRLAEDPDALATETVLCITGEEDLLISARGVTLVAASLPDAQVALIPASGHSVYFERAALFNAIMRRFLDGIGWG